MLKQHLFKSWLAICALLMLSFAQANETVTDYFKQLNTFQADFSQSVQQNGEIMQVSTGKVSLKKPMLFLWDYQTPEPIQIVSDGNDFYHYDVELMQATVKPVSEIANSPVALLLNDKKDLTEMFDITATTADEVKQWVIGFDSPANTLYRLTPKANNNENLQLSQAFIGFANNQLAFLSVQDELGTTTFSFSNVVENQAIDDTTFKFTAPDGVDVLGG